MRADTASTDTRLLTPPLLALCVAGFGIGTTEFVIMGLLPEVAHSLDVGLPRAGLLISAYALGVAFGGPPLSLALARFSGKASLLALLGVFILGNLGCALAPSYATLMAARVLTAFCHASFFGIGAVLAARAAPPGRKAQAMAVMFAGITLANVLGVPLGTFIGQAFGWRATFVVVAVIGLAALAAIAATVRPDRAEGPRDIRAEFRAIARPPVWMGLMTSVVASTAMFVFFTYITPLLTQCAGVPSYWVGAALLFCGIGLTIGNVIGARAADRRPLPALIAALILGAAAMLGFEMLRGAPVAAIAVATFWAGTAFAACAILQAVVVQQAGDAADLASTLNIAAFNLGNALGAALGAGALAQGLSLFDIPLLGAGVSIFGVLLTLLAMRLSPERAEESSFSEEKEAKRL